MTGGDTGGLVAARAGDREGLKRADRETRSAPTTGETRLGSAQPGSGPTRRLRRPCRRACGPRPRDDRRMGGVDLPGTGLCPAAADHGERDSALLLCDWACREVRRVGTKCVMTCKL